MGDMTRHTAERTIWHGATDGRQVSDGPDRNRLHKPLAPASGRVEGHGWQAGGPLCRGGGDCYYCSAKCSNRKASICLSSSAAS